MKITTEEEALEAVKEDSSALENVPEELKTPELCLVAVKQDGWALDYVPEELKTPELCLVAVKKNGSALEHVPETLKTPELCLMAVKQSGIALKYVPEALKTPELCLMAVRSMGSALEYVPEELKTPEFCLIAVKKLGWALKYVPEELKTPELCLMAVKQNSSALGYVPEKLITLELCLMAVKQDGSALEYVPDELLDQVEAVLNEEGYFDSNNEENDDDSGFEEDGRSFVKVAHYTEMTVTCKGKAAALENFTAELKARESKVVKEFYEILEKFKFFESVEYNKYSVIFRFDFESYKPYFFKLLVKAFPEIVFIFDFCYEGQPFGIEGFGRYYCVYEKGKKVYDASNYIETNDFLNQFLEEHDCSDFADYDYDDFDEFKEGVARGIAKWELKEEGKTITEKSIAKYIENSWLSGFEEWMDITDIYYHIHIGDILVKSILSEAKNFEFWYKNLSDSSTPFDADGYGYKHYLIRKKENELPALLAGRLVHFDWGDDNIATEDEAWEAMGQDGFALRYVPEALKTPKRCLEAVRQYPWAFKYVPEALKTPAFCLKAVKQDGSALGYVPEELKTPKLCLEAVKKDGSALKYVPKKLKAQIKAALKAEESKWKAKPSPTQETAKFTKSSK